MGYLGSKTRPHSLNIGKPCKHCRGYCSSPNILKIGQKGFYDEIQVKFEYGSLVFRN
jgi:hypothetical protein